MARERVFTDINFDLDGTQIGSAYADFNTDKSWFGNICIPIAQIKNGEGPAILLTAGVHGDEYEGQIALRNLVHRISAKDISGRIIIAPSLNLPACAKGTRLSPIDGENFNGSFPGSLNGSFSSILAHWVEFDLMKKVQYLVDVHSGGSSARFFPAAAINVTGQPDLDAKAFDLLLAFNAPHSLVWNIGNDRMLISAAARNNVVAIYGEFGGASTVSSKGCKLVQSGLMRVMKHIGILRNAQVEEKRQQTIFFEVLGQESYVFSRQDGVFEPFYEIGDELATNDTLGQMHSIKGIEKPTPYDVKASGTLFSIRHLGSTKAGDCLGHVATLAKEQTVEAMRASVRKASLEKKEALQL